MEKDHSNFDEQVHRDAVAGFDAILADMLRELRLGKIKAGSKQVLWAERLAGFYKNYARLVKQTIMGGLIDAAARDSNKKLVGENAKLVVELAYARGALHTERATSTKMYIEFIGPKLNSLLERAPSI